MGHPTLDTAAHEAASPAPKNLSERVDAIAKTIDAVNAKIDSHVTLIIDDQRAHAKEIEELVDEVSALKDHADIKPWYRRTSFWTGMTAIVGLGLGTGALLGARSANRAVRNLANSHLSTTAEFDQRLAALEPKDTDLDR